MDKLTPSAKLIIDALKIGPGNVHELSDRTGRSRSTTDKAIVELAKAKLIVKVDDGGDTSDGAPTRWQLANPADADTETTQAEPADGDAETRPDGDAPETPGVDETDAATQHADGGPTVSNGSPETAADAQPADPAPGSDSGIAETGADPQSDDTAKEDDAKQDEVEAPKLCRGCQTQMPKICEDCWQKTPAYCGKCRRTMPQVRRGEPGEPIILANGLPKLRPGELEAMVEKVIREQPLPAFAGVAGWTGGRLAIHLPGRSSGAITNALRKLARTGVAELIGDNPERYQVKPTEQLDDDPNGGGTRQPSASDTESPSAGG